VFHKLFIFFTNIFSQGNKFINYLLKNWCIIVPGTNPKHERRPTKNVVAVKHYNRMPLSKKAIISLVMIAIVLGSSIGAIIFFTNKASDTLYVEVGDTISVRYTLWVCDDEFVKLDYLARDELWEDILIKENASATSMIWGFWNALTSGNGMPNNVPTNILLDGCIDDGIAEGEGPFSPDRVAGDGWDDRYIVGVKRAETYGYHHTATDIDGIDTYDLRDTNLIFKIEVISITKAV
jgi:hypothetical protein